MQYLTKPFVKWVGGKKQLLEKLGSCMPKDYNRYYEPFIGGGALLFNVQPKDAVINDTNSQLINVYNQLKTNIEDVIKTVNTLDSKMCNEDYYLEIRDRYNSKIKSKELDAECASLMIWVNKHCFNGLYRVNSKGLFNVPYNNKVNGVSIDECNLRNISNYLNLNKVDIREGDFEAACSDVKKGDLVYFDSPYVPVSKTANFTNYTKDGFGLNDHKRLAKLFCTLDSLGAYIMLSNNDVPLVHELYSQFNVTSVDARRAVNRDATKRKGKEVIVTNF